MRALLNNDMIVKLTTDGSGVEIGSIPPGRGFECLRFNGSAVVDLHTLTEIWVRQLNGAFELHCIDVGSCQLVTMQYVQREALIIDNGIIRIKTALEIEYERVLEVNCRAKGKLVSKIKSELGGLEEMQIHTLAFVVALIVYARNQPPALGTFFDTLIPHIQDMYPMGQWEAILMNSAQKLKTIVADYNSTIQEVVEP